LGGISDRGGRRSTIDEVGQVAQSAQLDEACVLPKLIGEHGRLGKIAPANAALNGLEEPLMEGVKEVAGLQADQQAVISVVVVQKYAQHPLFSLQAVWRRNAELVSCCHMILI